MKQMNQSVTKFSHPFPHLIVGNMYSDEEFELIFEELNFLTKPNKLMSPFCYGASKKTDDEWSTNSKALILDNEYSRREISNILTVNRKLFFGGYLEVFSKIAPHCLSGKYVNRDITKIRYYQNDDYYEPHIDINYSFLAFSYFYKEPKKFEGGELFFPEYEYEVQCKNNSMILIPAYVTHGVKKVIIDGESYFNGDGRYCMSQFAYINPEEIKYD